MKYIAFVIVLGTVTALTGGNQIDCRKQDFPIHLRGSLEVILELESRSFNWTLVLLVKNQEATVAQIIFDFESSKLKINCTDHKNKWVLFQHSSTYKLKVKEKSIEVEQYLTRGEFDSISEAICYQSRSFHQGLKNTLNLGFHNVTLERFGGPEDDGLNISVCSPLNSTSATEDTATIQVILVGAVGLTIAVTTVVSAVVCALRKRKKKKKNAAAAASRTPSNPNRQESGDFFLTRIHQGPPDSDFDRPLCLNRRQLPETDDSSYATTQRTLTLPELNVSPSSELTGTAGFLSWTRDCNECHESQSSLASSSLAPTGHYDYGYSHLMVRSPQSPQLTMPNTNLSRTLLDVPSHYSTTGRPGTSVCSVVIRVQTRRQH
ncbi:uncharacterized protein LOC135195245 [Macrobrachium nipponense]|uniref:uncharacterized protein LOC135195245 n=1 Tax=Macrobrachium nipponense TaxID=159736 RepID=UPI0030C8113C